MRAWAAMFTDYFTTHDISPGYTDADYFTYVDGKPRYDGVRTMLASRGIALPEGAPTDPPTAETVCGLGNRKNAEFEREINENGVVAYPGSVALVDHLATLPIGLAIVSSSAQRACGAEGRGSRRTLRRHRRRRGRAEHELPGKPAPDTYAFAAKQLGTDDSHAVVVEDAVSGVQAGAAGDFGLVIGVDRGAGRRRCSTTAPTSSSPTSGSWYDTGPARHPAPRPRLPRPPPLPRRRVAPESSGSSPPTTSVVPRRCSPSATATSACAATSRRAASPTRTARSSTASTRRGRSSTPRRPSASPASVRRSSTHPTPRSSACTSTTSRCCCPSPT